MPVLVNVPHREESESEHGADTDAPLRGRRSVLCGTDCAAEPCTMRAMNRCANLAAEHELVVWTEANAATIAVMGTPLGPAPSLRRRFDDLADREVHCTLVFAAERAATARAGGMAGELDPEDFAARLVSVLARQLGRGPEPEAVDPRALTYGTFRWRDVKTTLTAAKKAGPDTPRTYPESREWERRGFVLTTETPASQLQELWRKPFFWREETFAASYGDPFRSGFRDAVDALAGATDEAAVKRAFRISCAAGPALDTLVKRNWTLLISSLKAGA